LKLRLFGWRFLGFVGRVGKEMDGRKEG